MDVRTGKYEDKDEDKLNQDMTVVYSIAIIILLIPIVLISLWGWDKHDTKVSRCTEITSATLCDSTQTSRLMAPSFGGPVYEQTIYSDYYEYEIGGEKYTARVWSFRPLPNVGLVDVYYNPNDTTEYYIDADIFDNVSIMFDDKWDSKSGSKHFGIKLI